MIEVGDVISYGGKEYIVIGVSPMACTVIDGKFSKYAFNLGDVKPTGKHYKDIEEIANEAVFN